MTTLTPVEVDGYVVHASFVSHEPCFATGEGNLFQSDSQIEPTFRHKGGILVAARSLDKCSVVTAGDDGRVIRTSPDGSSELIAEHSRKWIDLLACGPSGAVAFASGRTVWVRLPTGEEKEFPHERAVGGLAFAPKGLRLAVGHYGGATILWVGAEGRPQSLAWPGAHLDVAFSPEGKYLISALQENAIHGWRLSDAQDMRMTGYPAKTKSFSWSVKGRYLATSGANAAVLWPFFGKTGPMGQSPLQLGARGDALVTCVACHPAEDVVAVGYADGMIMMCRFEDNAEVLLRPAGKGSISALGWDDEGIRLVFGSEEAEAGCISLR